MYEVTATGSWCQDSGSVPPPLLKNSSHTSSFGLGLFCSFVLFCFLIKEGFQIPNTIVLFVQDKL